MVCGNLEDLPLLGTFLYTLACVALISVNRFRTVFFCVCVSSANIIAENNCGRSHSVLEFSWPYSIMLTLSRIEKFSQCFLDPGPEWGCKMQIVI